MMMLERGSGSDVDDDVYAITCGSDCVLFAVDLAVSNSRFPNAHFESDVLLL